jgi:V-type H+-transporting ATPase subunit a
MERKLRFLETEIKKDELPIYDPEDNPDAPKPREMIDLEVKYFLHNFFIFKTIF